MVGALVGLVVGGLLAPVVRAGDGPETCSLCAERYWWATKDTKARFKEVGLPDGQWGFHVCRQHMHELNAEYPGNFDWALID